MNFYNLLIEYPYKKEILKYTELQINKSYYTRVNSTSGDLSNYYFQTAPLDVNLPVIVLNKNVLMTDFIDTSSKSVFELGHHDIVISDSAKKIFEKYSKNLFQFYKIQIIHSLKNECTYWIMHSINNGYEFVDFEKSTIVKTEFGYKDLEIINVNSYQEFKKLVNYLQFPISIRIKKIVLKENLNLDIFSIMELIKFSPILLSEELKYEIEKNNLSGCKLELFKMD
jgi:hypothetical protein